MRNFSYGPERRRIAAVEIAAVRAAVQLAPGRRQFVSDTYWGMIEASGVRS
ncbi:MAG TPA: hypothetical protein VGG64_25530 [Pirellulales bacterium]